MAKKFWNELIQEYFDRADAGALREELDAWHKHDIYYGTTNVKEALINAFTNSKTAEYSYKRTHNQKWIKAANAYIKAARTVYKASNRSTTKTYKEGFVATIAPKKSTRRPADTDITATLPYTKAQTEGWAAAMKVLVKEFKGTKMGDVGAARRARQMDFLHADDPKSGKMGRSGKSSTPKDYYVPGKSKDNIGSRVTTVGSYAAAKMGDDSKFKEDLAAGKKSEGYVPGTEPGNEWGNPPNKMESWKGNMTPAMTEMFSDRASARILEYIEADLGWKATRSKSGTKGRKLEYIVQGSVGPRSSQEKRYPWDMPISSGEYARTGIQGRLEDILNEVALDMLNDISSSETNAKQIEASESIGVIMASDLAEATLDPIKKYFKTKKNVKVKVTRGTKKVQDNKKNQDRKKYSSKSKGKIKPKIIRSKAPKPAPKTTKAGNPDMRFKANKAAWGGRGAHSPIALTQLLNKALPEELKKNMTGVYPKSLEWRTGRFAQSAEVTSIVPFPNLTQIQYTYMKDPYEVFEGKGGRDPTQIIGGTIRQLAQSIMGTRFGLVRTKRV
jgi:hypothetical protein